MLMLFTKVSRMRKQKSFWVVALSASLFLLTKIIRHKYHGCIQCKLAEFRLDSSPSDEFPAIEYPQKSLGSTDLWLLQPGDDRWWIRSNLAICPEVPSESSPHLKKLVFLIPSVAGNFDAREILRKTWGSPQFHKTIPGMKKITIAFVFVIGDNPPKFNFKLEQEFKIFKDILQVDISDTYKNLTLKMQFAFHWAVSHCNHFDYVIKIDDDVYLNMHRFSDFILGLHPKESAFGGMCLLMAKPDRNRKSKWFLSPKQFSRTLLPPMCMGPMYFMSMDVAKSIYSQFAYVRRLHLEDVYMALCAERAFLVPNKNLSNEVLNWLKDRNPVIKNPIKTMAVHFSMFYPAIVHFHIMIETALTKRKLVEKFRIIGRMRANPDTWEFEVT